MRQVFRTRPQMGLWAMESLWAVGTEQPGPTESYWSTDSRPRPSESLRRCGGFRKALRRSRQAARSPALAFDRGGPVRLAVRRRPRPSESLRRCGGFRKALRRSRQAARSPALAFDRGGPVRLAVRRRPRPSESLRRCGGFRKALRRSRQAARSPALAFDRGGPVRLAAPQAFRKPPALRRLSKGLAPEQTGGQVPAAMVQTLSSRRLWRRELSVLLAQSATPATLSPAPCASCWPNHCCGYSSQSQSKGFEGKESSVERRPQPHKKKKKIRMSPTFPWPMTLRLRRQPKYPRKNALRRNKLDHYAIIKFPLTTESAMKKIEDRHIDQWNTTENPEINPSH
ncbi:LOW QUALITY PROTEIN: hypothetical protein QTO34_007983 [Cnephaeus nilssonii]|uniref:Large ribosomal subunit protein uL23 N-terminal domain-containing protein n=1 Tax=Cnephaeus nilssonii TaxID=3371016 RepID=A0AA40LTR2_CNENI|nr:LOW QUALITY PROTEIN: hypothetical protein QTO34_007983 [Eptesicus nilssonii]